MVARKSIFGNLLTGVRAAPETVALTPATRVPLAGRALRIAAPAAALEIDLGGQRLRVEPDLAVDGRALGDSPAFVVSDANQTGRGIRPAIRLKPGERLEIDGSARIQRLLFTDPANAFRFRLRIAHEGETLLLAVSRRDLDAGLTALDPLGIETSLHRRQRALGHLVDIYGGSIEPLPGDLALATLLSVCESLREEPYRELSTDGCVGGILRLPSSVTPIIVGDLHGNVDNLLKILTMDGVLAGLDRGTVALVLLGDAIHPDFGDALGEFGSSMLLMDLLLRVKQRYPAGVFLLLGNHESFSPDVMKAGVAQGVLWENHLRSTRGEAYRDAMAVLYDRLPLVAVSRTFVACHAGPPQRRTTREMLLDVRRYPAIINELTWNRFRSLRCPAGYTAADVRRLRKSLDLKRSVPFIVGHQPCSDTETLWLNVGGIDAHHVVYSARSDDIGVFLQSDDEIVPLIVSSEPLMDWVNIHLAGRARSSRQGVACAAPHG